MPLTAQPCANCKPNALCDLHALMGELLMPKDPAAVKLGRKGGKSTSSAKQAAVRANVAKARAKRQQNRESDGKYAFDGNLERLCVCGHELGVHGASSPSVCIFYSLSEAEQKGQPGADNPNCGCLKFRESRKAKKSALDRQPDLLADMAKSLKVEGFRKS